MPRRARLTVASKSARGAASAWFGTWQLMLTRAVQLAVQAAAAVLAVAARFVRSCRIKPGVAISFANAPRATSSSASKQDRTRLAALGACCFVAGMILLVALGRYSGIATRIGIARAFTEGVWAVARIAIVAYLARRSSVGEVPAVMAALAGLTPYLLGLTPGLLVAAFAASAFYTGEALRGLGASDAEARFLLVWSYGAQAAVMAFAWLLRAGVALLAA